MQTYIQNIEENKEKITAFKFFTLGISRDHQNMELCGGQNMLQYFCFSHKIVDVSYRCTIIQLNQDWMTGQKVVQ